MGPMHATGCSLAEIIVPAAGAIPPAPAVPTSTWISARLKCVREHSSRVNVCVCVLQAHARVGASRVRAHARVSCTHQLVHFVDEASALRPQEERLEEVGRGFVWVARRRYGGMGGRGVNARGMPTDPGVRVGSALQRNTHRAVK